MNVRKLLDACDRGDEGAVTSMVREEMRCGAPVVAEDVVRRTKRECDEGLQAHPYRDHATGLASALDRVLSGEKRHSSAFYDREDLCECAAKIMSDNAVSLAKSTICLRRRQLEGRISERNEWTCAVDGPCGEDHVGFAVDEATGRIDTFVTDGVKVVVMANPAMTGFSLLMGFRLRTSYPSYDARDADCMWHRGASATLVRQSRTYLGADAVGRAYMLERCRPDHMCPMDCSYEDGLHVYGRSSVVAIGRGGSLSVDGIPCDDATLDMVAKTEPKLVAEARRVLADVSALAPAQHRERTYADLPDDLFSHETGLQDDDIGNGPSYG